LISHIEEWEEFSLFDDCAHFLPLFGTRVNAGGIVCTCVEQDRRSFGNSADVFHRAGEVEAARLWLVVAVRLHGEACVLNGWR
jgi:hypothetical protein